jgi:hypothetical protein
MVAKEEQWLLGSDSFMTYSSIQPVYYIYRYFKEYLQKFTEINEILCISESYFYATLPKKTYQKYTRVVD